MCTCVHCAGFVCGCAYSNVYVRRTHAENVPSTRLEMMPSYDMSCVAGRGELVLGGGLEAKVVLTIALKTVHYPISQGDSVLTTP